MSSKSFDSIPLKGLFFVILLVSNSPYIVSSQSIIDFCTGEAHACALFDTNQFKCWGYKYAWGLGSGASDNLGDTPSELGNAIPFINIGTSVGVDQISCGAANTCVKLDTGALKCLGENNYGQTGLGLTTNPIGELTGYIGDNLPVVNLGSGLSVLSVASGASGSCALLTGNKVKCFGRSTFGELGQGDKLTRGTSPSHMGDNLPFVELGTGVEVASIHTGHSAAHFCVILSLPAASAQRAKCWGNNHNNNLAYGDTNYRGDAPGEMGDNLPLVDLGVESRVKQFALSSMYSCALLYNDKMKCWGEGSGGKLGSGSSADITGSGSAIPFVTIDSSSTIKFIETGYAHTCIVYLSQTTMKCFGANSYGQLGQGDTTNRGNTAGTKVPNIPAIKLGTGTLKIASIHGGTSFNCVVYVDSSVKCFGKNQNGQLAIGSTITKGDNTGEMGANLQFANI